MQQAAPALREVWGQLCQDRTSSSSGPRRHPVARRHTWFRPQTHRPARRTLLLRIPTAPTLDCPLRNVAAGSYYIRVYARNSSCASPLFLSPASNEVLMVVPFRVADAELVLRGARPLQQ